MPDLFVSNLVHHPMAGLVEPLQLDPCTSRFWNVSDLDGVGGTDLGSLGRDRFENSVENSGVLDFGA